MQKLAALDPSWIQAVSAPPDQSATTPRSNNGPSTSQLDDDIIIDHQDASHDPTEEHLTDWTVSALGFAAIEEPDEQDTEQAALALEQMALGRSQYGPLGSASSLPLVGNLRLAPGEPEVPESLVAVCPSQSSTETTIVLSASQLAYRKESASSLAVDDTSITALLGSLPTREVSETLVDECTFRSLTLHWRRADFRACRFPGRWVGLQCKLSDSWNRCTELSQSSADRSPAHLSGRIARALVLYR